jgi:hypothetical protein
MTNLLFAAGKNPRGIDNSGGTEILVGDFFNNSCGMSADFVRICTEIKLPGPFPNSEILHYICVRLT